LFATFSCSGGSDAPASTAPSANDAGSLIYAKGWTQVTINANYAKTLIDNTGHFSTDRNACGEAANGVIDLDQWNTLAGAINGALAALQVPTTSTAPGASSHASNGSSASTSSDTPQDCPTQPDGAKMDGTMDVVLDDGTQKSIFENLGPGQVCSSIVDNQLTQNLYNAINLVVVQADQTDCAHQ
jgi:hypothetical protein